MAALDAGKARFCGSAPALGRGNGTRVSALFKARNLPASCSPRQRAGIALSCTHCKRAHTVRSVVELKGAAKDAETSTQARDLCCSVLVLVLASRHVYVRCVCQ